MRNPSSSSKAKSSSPAATPTKTPCCVKVGLKRGPWTPEEDELLSNYIKKEGEGRWRTLPKRAGLLRCGKSCRLRWMNYLRPSVKRGQIAPDEEDLILRLHRLLGNRWSLIAGRIPGRTDNEIKNYWNTHLSKKLINQGIDPRTHKPLNPDNCSSAGGGDHHAVFHHGANSSSAKTNQTNLLPSSNPNPKSPTTSPSLVTTEEEEVEAAAPTIGYNVSTNDLGIIVHGGTGYGSLNSDGSALRSNSGVMLMGNGEDEDINCCTDDVFSSFLNSLINEDPFAVAGHHQMQMPQLQHQPSNGVAAPQPAGGDSLATAAGFGGWESAVLMSSAFIQNDPHRVNVDQTE